MRVGNLHGCPKLNLKCRHQLFRCFLYIWYPKSDVSN